MSAVINLLGKNLSDILEKPKPACVGLIKLALKDQGIEDSFNNNTLTLQSTKEMLENSLKKRLKTINAKDPEKIIEKLEHILRENQAIFTMSKNLRDSES